MIGTEVRPSNECCTIAMLSGNLRHTELDQIPLGKTGFAMVLDLETFQYTRLLLIIPAFW